MKKIIILFISLYAYDGYAYINSNAEKDNSQPSRLRPRAGDCVRGVAKEFLDINNIRATLLNSGDLWWDRTNAGYEAPKRSQEQVDNKARTLSPLFEGSIWISGKVGGNLRMAAIQYSGVQGAAAFWPGTIKQGEGSIGKDKCNKFDKFWKVTGKEIEDAERKLLEKKQKEDELKQKPNTRRSNKVSNRQKEWNRQQSIKRRNSKPKTGGGEDLPTSEGTL